MAERSGKRTDMITVRPATAADSPAMAEILNAIIARGGTTAHETPVAPDAFADLGSGAAARACCHVAVSDGVIVGFQTLEPHAALPTTTGSIATFVRIGTTQGGIGTALFAATQAAAPALGFDEIDATIRADNTGGLRYYARMGFADHAVSPGVPLSDGTPVDRIHKRLKL